MDVYSAGRYLKTSDFRNSDGDGGFILNGNIVDGYFEVETCDVRINATYSLHPSNLCIRFHERIYRLCRR
jgi:hypothetical protein